MTCTFAAGVVTGTVSAAALFCWIAHRREWLRARTHDRVRRALVERLSAIQLPVPKLSTHKFDRLTDELSAVVLERVNAKLPPFLPISTRASVNEYLAATIKHDTTAIMERVCEEYNSTVAAKLPSYRRVILNLIEELYAPDETSPRYRSRHNRADVIDSSDLWDNV